MANFDFKAATPDTTFPANGFLFGADSQSAADPSIYSHLAYRDYILSLAAAFAANGAVSAPAVTGTGTWYSGGTATTTKPAWLIEPTGTTSTGWSTSGTGLGINAASGFVGNLFDAQLAGVSKLKADVNGIITVASSGGIITSSGGIILSGATALFGITSAAGNDVASITSTGEIKMKSSGSIGWTNVAYSNTTPDLVLLRDAASTLAIRDSTNAQTFNVYNTYTDVSNYERARFLWSGNAFYIGTVAAGTGTGRDINLSAGNRLYLGAGGVSNQWHIDTSGHFLATTDNTYDIGATGGTSPKDIYAAGILAAKRGTATPAGGVQAIRLGSTTTLGVFYGSGAPSATAGKGSIYLRSDGSGTTDRAYINTDGGTTWTALTTVA